MVVFAIHQHESASGAVRDLKQLYFEIVSKLEKNYKNSVKNFLHSSSVFIWASLVVQTVKNLPAV